MLRLYIYIHTTIHFLINCRRPTCPIYAGSIKAVLRLYSGSIKALVRLYEGSIKAYMSIKALLRLYTCIHTRNSLFDIVPSPEMSHWAHRELAPFSSSGSVFVLLY